MKQAINVSSSGLKNLTTITNSTVETLEAESITVESISKVTAKPGQGDYSFLQTIIANVTNDQLGRFKKILKSAPLMS